jgi:hypothetical protein
LDYFAVAVAVGAGVGVEPGWFGSRSTWLCAKTLELAKQHASKQSVPMILGIDEHLIF